MNSVNHLETHHGVLMKINDQGVFICGEAGIGKSSLALELLDLGHQLIADDMVEFHMQHDHLIGTCPELLFDLLHVREIGLIKVSQHFGERAWQPSCAVDYIIALERNLLAPGASMSLEQTQRQICLKSLPVASLSLNNPASLACRLIAWLKVNHSVPSTTSDFIARQRMAMEKIP